MRISTPIAEWLASAPAGAYYPGLTLATIEFTPTDTGFVLFGGSWDGSSNPDAEDFLNFLLVVHEGAYSVSGGTVVDGVRLYQGDAPTITVGDGTITTVPGYVSCSVLRPGGGDSQIAGSPSWDCAAQLVPGTTYLLELEVYGTNPAAAYPYPEHLITLYAAELPASAGASVAAAHPARDPAKIAALLARQPKRAARKATIPAPPSTKP